MQRLISTTIFYLIFYTAPSIALADSSQDVKALYKLVSDWYFGFLMPLGAILAGIVILITGIMYASSGGDSSKTGRAKELIFGALTGLIILVSASLIIRTLIG